MKLMTTCAMFLVLGVGAASAAETPTLKTMKEACAVPEPEAFKEARRGGSDPGYFSYTLGKLEILKLREDVKAKEGDKFTLQSFHDRFPGAGPIPINLIRREILGQDGPSL